MRVELAGRERAWSRGGDDEGWIPPLISPRVRLRSPHLDYYQDSLKESYLRWESMQTPVSSRNQAEKSKNDLTSRISELVSKMSTSSKTDLIEALAAFLAPIDSELWGEPPDIFEALSAPHWHESTAAERELSVVDESLSMADASRRIGIDEARLCSLVESGKVSALRRDRVTLIPVWQIDDNGRLVDGLESVVQAFNGSAVALALWAARIHPELGVTPLHALSSGRIDDVVEAATAGDYIA